jgi:predicted RND superfamily exporter protein
MTEQKPTGGVLNSEDAQRQDSIETIENLLSDSIETIAKLLMSLNGAGFFAIPTIAGLFHINAAAVKPLFWFGLLFLVGAGSAGLVFVNKLFVLKAMLRLHLTEHRLNKVRDDATRAASDDHKRKERNDLEDNLVALKARIEKTFWRALLLIVVSFLCFLLGAIFGLWIVAADPGSL